MVILLQHIHICFNIPYMARSPNLWVECTPQGPRGPARMPRALQHPGTREAWPARAPPLVTRVYGQAWADGPSFLSP